MSISNMAMGGAQALLDRLDSSKHTEDEALARESQQAQQADAILNNPLFEAVFDECIDELMTAWVHSEPRDRDGRELAYNRIQALHRVREALVGRIAQGRLATAVRRAETEK
jgi:hypothetical protein